MATIIRENITYTEEQVPHTLAGFKTWKFSSGSVIDEDFRVFARLFKKYVSNNLPEGSSLAKYNRGHYDISGFVERQGRFVYFSIPDVRFFPGEWFGNVLIRTAKSAEDYTGGNNCYTILSQFKQNVQRLLQAETTA